MTDSTSSSTARESSRRTRQVTTEGFERAWATNYLSHFLLTNLLLETLKASAPARIINVATKTLGLKLDLDDLPLTKGRYAFTTAMGRTKLALILFTMELAKRLEGTGVTVNAVHPGVTKTGLLDDLARPLKFLFGLMGRSAEKAASGVVYLATSPDVETVSGEALRRRQTGEHRRPGQGTGSGRAPVDREFLDDEAAHRLAPIRRHCPMSIHQPNGFCAWRFATAYRAPSVEP
jgi:NAD(P)-dependent dehydrogenase (short-subunit alcohol dehydrogenase family)